MDGLEALPGSATESKAERIARYKAERRRELAERYANLEDPSSKYARRERHQANPEMQVPKPDKAAKSSAESSAAPGEKEAQSRVDGKEEAAAAPVSADDRAASESRHWAPRGFSWVLRGSEGCLQFLAEFWERHKLHECERVPCRDMRETE
ncbi:hypothetical protein P4O66_001437 [Electrophorus voltai]|uniref:Uncharacterized protein n=1 Tax=Electrophorus voltai TaxID=2609070 RepID=A0AAD8Z6N4_9TELE|nr:hypothetical protein P4O66_001437 [Electrophorus voltai]